MLKLNKDISLSQKNYVIAELEDLVNNIDNDSLIYDPMYKNLVNILKSFLNEINDNISNGYIKDNELADYFYSKI